VRTKFAAEQATSWTAVSTPVGTLTAVASDTGLLRLAFAEPARVLPEFDGGDLREGDGIAADVHTELTEYFGGRRRRFDVPIDWSLSEGLRLHVLRTLYEQVPFGETLSYRQLAELSGHPTATRAVGTIMGSNPIAVVVPCHRILASGGGLGGYGPGLEAKRRLLVLEGSLGASLLELDLLPD
jgi:methylated-DNA-[protein]-cysteine S-methyltransferase